MTTAINAIKQSMAKTNALFNTEIFGKRNFAAIDQIYTRDARILPPGRPMFFGRPEIKGFWFDIIRSFNAKSAVDESVDMLPAGDGVHRIWEGHAHATTGGPTGGAVRREVCRLLEAGRWVVEVARGYLEYECVRVTWSPPLAAEGCRSFDSFAA